MALGSPDFNHQNSLKRELQNSSPLDLERLVAALLGRLIDVPIVVASSGFQHGADVGTAGEQGRRLRLECKRYSDTSNLSERELLGEIDQALNRDKALEAWVLVATREISEQIRQSLMQKGEKIGVPVLTIGWTENDEIAPLAALSSFAPDLVRQEISIAAGEAAFALKEVSRRAIAATRRNMQSWCLGFESLRELSHEHLNKIWTSSTESNAKFGQNAAGGDQPKRIRREGVHEKLSAWWKKHHSDSAPAVVVGMEGVGKTWATLDWLIDHSREHPIVLVVSSSMIPVPASFSEIGVKKFLAGCLYEISGTRDSEYWLYRLENMLKRPTTEGPVLTIFFDGLNQEPSVQWLQLFKTLQGESFANRIRTIATVRNHYFENNLHSLKGLVTPAIRVDIGGYDTTPGGELDQMLRFEDLKQQDLHPDVLQLARNPRLFKLVVSFRENLTEPGQATVHRLLWEYGRDSFGVLTNRSFSENEWRDWLREIARQNREGITEYSIRSIGQTVDSPELTKRDVYIRLSDIVDGQFSQQDQAGCWRLDPVLVAHALGVALLSHLEQVEPKSFDTLNNKLTEWFEPVSSLDGPAEILRAAISVLVEQGQTEQSAVTGVLVTTLLQSQNVTDTHRNELVDLGSSLCSALLDVVEHSESSSQSSARFWAVKALRNIPRTDNGVQDLVIKRASRWLSVISRGVTDSPTTDAESEKWRSQQLIERIGVDHSGPITVAGVKLELVDYSESSVQEVIPSLIEGFPLASALPIFKLAAVAFAIKGKSKIWQGLKWLCLLNEVDPGEAAIALRSLSEQILNETLEPNVHPDLPRRIAALLRWLTGMEEDDKVAASIDPGLDRPVSYEEDYLAQPGRSLWFRLERRHANEVLKDTQLSPIRRSDRIDDLWLDPNFEPPDSFVSEISSEASAINVEKLHPYTGLAGELHKFEQLERTLARCDPDLLAKLVCRKMRSIDASPDESRPWNSYYAPTHILLGNESEKVAAKKLRVSRNEEKEIDELCVACNLLSLEIRDLEAPDQIDTLICANLQDILLDVSKTLRCPTPDEVDALIQRHGSVTRSAYHLLASLSHMPDKLLLTDKAWLWAEGITSQDTDKESQSQFRLLARLDPVRFGQHLDSRDWAWDPIKNIEVNHHGTLALIKATLSTPFKELAPRLAPWLLLKAVRLRGSKVREVEHAAAILGRVLIGNGIDVPDPGSILTIDVNEDRPWPLTYSVELRPSQNEAEHMRIALDAQLRAKVYQNALDTAEKRIHEAQQSGASLYLMSMEPMDFEPVLQHFPNIVKLWLEGINHPTEELKRRIQLAEGAFLALCEALLVHKPELGVKLWWILKDTIISRYIGLAKIDDLLHMIFRVPNSPPVSELRQEMASWKYSNTDQDLFDLVIAASCNGETDWLLNLVEEDKKSKFAWRRRRAETLAGMTINNKLPIHDAWPKGEIRMDHEAHIANTARSRWLEACARHWWYVYLNADNVTDAYAAWHLFLQSADRRAWIWVCREIENLEGSVELDRLKRVHVQLNKSKLREATSKHYSNLDGKYLGLGIYSGIGPWLD